MSQIFITKIPVKVEYVCTGPKFTTRIELSDTVVKLHNSNGTIFLGIQDLVAIAELIKQEQPNLFIEGIKSNGLGIEEQEKSPVNPNKGIDKTFIKSMNDLIQSQKEQCTCTLPNFDPYSNDCRTCQGYIPLDKQYEPRL